MEHSEAGDVTGSPTYLLGQIDANVKTLLHEASGHEKRIRWLERFSYIAVGGGTVSYTIIKMPWVTSALAAFFH